MDVRRWNEGNKVFGSFVWTIIYLSPAVNLAKHPMKIEGILFLQKGMNKP